MVADGSPCTQASTEAREVVANAVSVEESRTTDVTPNADGRFAVSLVGRCHNLTWTHPSAVPSLFQRHSF